jgi:hypothetical protein
MRFALVWGHAVARDLLLVEQVVADQAAGSVGEDDAAAVPELFAGAAGVAGEVEERLGVAGAELSA